MITKKEMAILAIASLLMLVWWSFVYGSERNFSETELGFDPVIENELRAAGYEPNELISETPEPKTRLRLRSEPMRVGIQAGHWKSSEAPDELYPLRRRTGATGGGITEAEAVLVIAEETQKLLEKEGVVVDLLPATVPPGYRADAFVSIHADGNGNPAARGYKVGSPYRDASGKSHALEQAIYRTYGAATRLPEDSNITNAMRGYYAFNWRAYSHAIHPLTPAAIIETGFITNPADRALIVDEAERAARGIADGVLDFLEN